MTNTILCLAKVITLLETNQVNLTPTNEWSFKDGVLNYGPKSSRWIEQRVDRVEVIRFHLVSTHLVSTSDPKWVITNRSPFSVQRWREVKTEVWFRDERSIQGTNFTP